MKINYTFTGSCKDNLKLKLILIVNFPIHGSQVNMITSKFCKNLNSQKRKHLHSCFTQNTRSLINQTIQESLTCSYIFSEKSCLTEQK